MNTNYLFRITLLISFCLTLTSCRLLDSDVDTDNDKIVFASNLEDNWDIYTVLSDGSQLSRLTDSPSNDIYPVWSSDYNQIAFQSDRNGSRDIFIMNANGSDIRSIERIQGTICSPLGRLTDHLSYSNQIEMGILRFIR